jgi:hypothetical protein
MERTIGNGNVDVLDGLDASNALDDVAGKAPVLRRETRAAKSPVAAALLRGVEAGATIAAI